MTLILPFSVIIRVVLKGCLIAQLQRLVGINHIFDHIAQQEMNIGVDSRIIRRNYV